MFYSFYKLNYWELVQYEEIYNHLIQLKNTLVSNNTSQVSMLIIGTMYDNLKRNKIRIMIRFIFRNTNIQVKIHHNTLIEPESHEIKIISAEYHSNPTSEHSGFHKTYSLSGQKLKRTLKML